MRKSSILLPVLLVLATSAAGAQSVGVAARPARVDGVVEEGEYSWSESHQTIALHLSRTGDRPFAAVEAEAEGWIGVGFGSTRMDGAHIFSGYVGGGGPEIVQQLGRGHSHRDTREPVQFEYRLSESSGVTTLELSLPAAAYIAGGQERLELIVACGEGDRTNIYHVYHRGVTVDL